MPDVNVRAFDGWTPLMYAATGPNAIECIKLLLKAGADVNVTNDDNQTALYELLKKEECNPFCSECCKLFIDAGANINAGDSRGNTPLHLALGLKNAEQAKECSRMLIEAGANFFTAVNNDGDTPYDIAKRNDEFNDIISLMFSFSKIREVSQSPINDNKSVKQENTPIYQNKTYILSNLLMMAENNSLAIPNIQRPFVWKPYQVARYIDSLMHGWPCGSLLLWNTDENNQKIFATRGFTLLHKLQGAPASQNDSSKSNMSYSQLILDGQQRMQSLVLAFSAGSKGIEATPRDWSLDSGSSKGTTKNYERKLLCFNLAGWSNDTARTMPSFHYLDYEEDDLDNTPCLQWRTETEIEENSGNLIPLCWLPKRKIDESPALSWLRERVDFILNGTQFPVLEVNRLDHTVESMDDDEAIVQIFTRLNTAGTPLTKEQIQAARINSLWKDFQNRIDSLQDILSKDPYRLTISDDDLINGYNITLRAWYKEDSLNAAYQRAKEADEWDDIWDLFSHYTRECILALLDKKLAYNAEYKSLYILWFPVAHLCCTDGGKSTEERTEISENLAHLLVKWVLVTSWARIWANRSGQYVKAYTKKLVNRGDEGTESWLSVILLEASLTKAACDSIDNLAASHRGSVRQYYLPLWAWTRFTSERAKFILSFGDESFAVDHIVPVARITDANLKAKYNSIGNCWMLNYDANIKKSDNDFVSFLKSYDITDVTDAATQLGCTEEYLKANKPADEYCNYISARENEIKQCIKNFITTPDMKLYYPSEREVLRRTYHHNTEGIYRGEQYTKTEKFLNLGFKSQQSYLSNIRGCLTELSLTETIQDKGTNELRELLDRAKEMGNKASAWRRYLEFLLGEDNTLPVNRIVRQRQQVKRVNNNHANANRAVERAARVMNSPRQANHILIRTAIAMGCTDQVGIYWPNVKEELGPEPGRTSWDRTLASCMTNAGQNYGHYFNKNDDYITFTPEVWEEIQRIGWDRVAAN